MSLYIEAPDFLALRNRSIHAATFLIRTIQKVELALSEAGDAAPLSRAEHCWVLPEGRQLARFNKATRIRMAIRSVPDIIDERPHNGKFVRRTLVVWEKMARRGLIYTVGVGNYGDMFEPAEVLDPGADIPGSRNYIGPYDIKPIGPGRLWTVGEFNKVGMAPGRLSGQAQTFYELAEDMLQPQLVAGGAEQL